MDYSLTDSSYCINKGTADTTGLNLTHDDIAGNPRIIGDTIDIGAYEYTVNFPPTDIMLSNSHIEENVPSGSVVGILTTQDDNNTDAHTYSFDTGDGINDIDNNCFVISVDTLKINLAPDYEDKDTFRIWVKTIDNGVNTLSYSKGFILVIEDVNEQPVIEPQSFYVDENSQKGTVIGTITASDADKGQTLTYSIISGNTDNAFTVDSCTGEITVDNSDALDYETAPSFGLTISVKDDGHGNLTNEALITVNINDIDEPVSVNDFTFDVLDIYPNPVKESVYIEFSDEISGELLLELRSVNGTIYYQSEINLSLTDRIIKLELSGLSEGLYILNLRNENILTTRKISIIGIR
jgi:hypothetical protein